MAFYNIVMPKMGESVQEATITRWLKQPGDNILEDDILLEIATDKVDSEIPSPVSGILAKVLFPEGSKVPVGEIIAVLNTEGTEGSGDETDQKSMTVSSPVQKEVQTEQTRKESAKTPDTRYSGRFYSPLVQSIAKKESISGTELDSIQGSGSKGRLRKNDLLEYVEKKKHQVAASAQQQVSVPETQKITAPVMPGDEVVEMDRIRKLTAEHMVMSRRISPHVSNFVEADVTAMVLWRDKVKDDFLKREKHKLTFMPIFIEAVAKALKEFPGVNASVDGNSIILRKSINIGIAVALPSWNLIVPVIHNADQMSLLGLSLELNRLAEAARSNKLKPDDIQGGTFTISNFGTFKNITGTPIINQPQVAILATGMIEKKPAVIETPTGDVLAIRHKMILSLSYDHRVVDGALGGAFLRKIADLLEQFDTGRAL